MSKNIYLSDNNARLGSFREEIEDVVRKETRKSNRIKILLNIIIALVVSPIATLLVEAGWNYYRAEQRKMKSIVARPVIEFDRETPERFQESPSHVIVIDDLASALNHKEIKAYFTRVATWIANGAYLDPRVCPACPILYFTSLKAREDFICNLPGGAVFANLDDDKDRFTDFTDEASEPKWDTHGYLDQIEGKTYYVLHVFPSRAEISRVESQ